MRHYGAVLDGPRFGQNLDWHENTYEVLLPPTHQLAAYGIRTVYYRWCNGYWAIDPLDVLLNVITPYLQKGPSHGHPRG